MNTFNPKNPKFNQQQNKKNIDSKEWEKYWNDKWITDAIDEKAILFAEERAEEMQNNGLTTSQIRNFFSEVIRIKESGIEKNKIDFLLLKPKIAYAAGRAGKKGTLLFKDIMVKGIDLVLQAKDDTNELKKRFKNFHALFEAILAYHKVYAAEK
jgi:CRISPR-associated protein Csm2